MTATQKLERERVILEAAQNAAKQTIAGIRGRRSQVALAASRGDRASVKKLAEIESDERTAVAAAETATLALASLEEELSAAHEKESKAERKRRIKIAKEEAANTIAISKQIDSAVAGVVDLLARRKEAMTAIQRLGLLTSDIHRMWLASDADGYGIAVLGKFSGIFPNSLRADLTTEQRNLQLEDLTRKRLTQALNTLRE